ncbi:MAG TPA: EamA family transporter [Vicinamibacterales bacterium]|nr:EamA family transporter [Vicinamibacterales bacterium]
MASLVALASAVLYGAADFVGGIASRHAATVAVVAVSQAVGLVLLAILVAWLPSAAPTVLDFGWGAVAGMAGGVGVAWLYRALAVGTMALVAPVTAVCAVMLPVAAECISGRWPRPMTVAGIGLALLSIALISQTPPSADDSMVARPHGRVPGGLGLALLSGVAIGIFYLALARTAREAGLWPLVAARSSSALFFCAAAFARGAAHGLPRRVIGWSVAGGTMDVAANALYLAAARLGPLSEVVTLASLYPASTVILAKTVLGERLSRLQSVGIICALAAVLMIVAG